MLQTPVRAQRRAATLRLSITLDTLSARRAYYRYELDPGWWLIVIRDGIAFDALARAYTRRLPGWARARIYTPLGVTDPAEDLAAYQQGRRWDPAQPVTAQVFTPMEEVAAAGGYVIPWPHAWLLDTPARLRA